MTTTYRVYVPEAKELFPTWIDEQGGILVWNNCDMSDPGRENAFTPALDEDGNDNAANPPRWNYKLGERVDSLARFQICTRKLIVAILDVELLRQGSSRPRLVLSKESECRIYSARNIVAEIYGTDEVKWSSGDIIYPAVTLYVFEFEDKPLRAVWTSGSVKRITDYALDECCEAESLVLEKDGRFVIQLFDLKPEQLGDITATLKERLLGCDFTMESME